MARLPKKGKPDVHVVVLGRSLLATTSPAATVRALRAPLLPSVDRWTTSATPQRLHDRAAPERGLVLASAALVAGLPSAQADVTVNYSSGAPAVLTGTALTATNLGAPGLLPQPTAIQVIGERTVSSLNIGASTTLTINQLVDATTLTQFLSASNSALIDVGNFAKWKRHSHLQRGATCVESY